MALNMIIHTETYFRHDSLRWWIAEPTKANGTIAYPIPKWMEIKSVQGSVTMFRYGK